MSLVLPVCAILILSLALANFVKFCRNIYKLSTIPSPPILNFATRNIGHLNTTQENIFSIIRKWAKEYYPIFTLSFFYRFIVVIQTAENCELIMSNPKHNNKSRLYGVLHHWLGKGLLTSGGAKWTSRRKILTPAFHFTILQQFVNIFNEETGNLVSTFTDLCSQPYIALNTHVTKFTLKTIAETSMGCKLNFESEKDLAYHKAVSEYGKIAVFKVIKGWYMDKVFNALRLGFYHEWKTVKTLHKFSKSVIKEREKNFDDYKLTTDLNYRGNRRLAMLDLMLMAKQSNSIDDKGIQEEVDTFMFEGHDTTASAVCFSLMALACNKDAQDRVVEEMSAVLGDLRKTPTYEDLQNLKYMERTIKEVLRIYPSVPLITRKTGEDVILNDYFVPKNTNILILLYDLHHDPKYFPDPEKFDPDRFLPENSQNRHPFAFLPFSAGFRNCIGQKFAILELKTVLCGILANFVLEPVDTPETITFLVDLILKTKEPIKVKFVRRN